MVLGTEWSQVEIIDLVNEGNGLGFMLVGGRSTGVVVKALIPGGAAERDGRLQASDHLLQINEVALRGFSSDQVAQVLRQTGHQVRLIVGRSVEPSSVDFQAITSHAPIIPTKLLSDPEELERILQQTGGFSTTGDLAACSAEKTPEANANHISRLMPRSSPAPVSTTTGTATASTGTENATTETAKDMELLNNNSILGNSLGKGLIKRPDAILFPEPLVQCDGVDSTTTCSSEEALDSPETEVYEVELHKNVYGLGITVAGYVCEEEDLSGIFVKSIIEGSAAEMSGVIQINDRIVEVDGRSLNGVTNHQAVDILRKTDIAVNLKLERFLRGRKYEHLQTALTEMRGSSTPSTPICARSIGGVKTPRQSMGSTKSMDLILEEKRSSEDSLEEPKGTNKKSKINESEDYTPTRNTVDGSFKSINDHGVHMKNDDIRAGADGGQVVIENEMESHTTIDSNVYANDYVLNGDDEDDNELVMIEANLAQDDDIIRQHHPLSLHTTNDSQQDPIIKSWQAELPQESKVIVVELNKLSGLGISLEGTVEVEGGLELHPHHFIRSILEEGPVGRNGVLRPGDELLQANDYRLQGLRHIEVVRIIKDLPRHVKLVCARGPKPPSVINTSQSPDAFQARSILGPTVLLGLQNLLTRAQSESSLYTSSTGTLTDQQRSKSFEQVSGLALWSCEVVYVDIEKTDTGFGFSILDYQDPLDPDGTVIVVRGLIPGGSAEATGLIFPGDRLIYVNSVNLHGMTLDQAVAVLKCIPVGRVRLGMCRPLSTSDSNIDESPQSAAETPTT